MELLLVTSSFCAACARTREVLTEATRLVPAVGLRELDVARGPDEAEELDIRSTPTVILRDDDGREVFRAEGVPTVPQVLTVLADALPAPD